MAILLALLALTYATPLPGGYPMLCGLIYMVAGFLFLGLMGLVFADGQTTPPAAGEPSGYRPLLEFCGFIVGVYGRLFRCGRLWSRPEPSEIDAGAQMLGHLAAGIGVPAQNDLAPKRIVAVLVDLKLIEQADGRLTLTPQGTDLVKKALGKSAIDGQLSQAVS